MAVQFTDKRHPYARDKHIHYVSKDAADEVDANWHEFVGWAHGYAKVSHPDWQEVYDYYVEHYGQDWPKHLLEQGCGPCFLIHCRVEGTTDIAHIGSIVMRKGQLEVEG